MHKEEDCGCGGQGQHHGEHYGESHGGDCGCRGHGRHGMYGAWHHGGQCGCGSHHGGMGFNRRFVSHDEMIGNLEEYLKQLQAEAKGVKEHIAELKKSGESRQT